MRTCAIALFLLCLVFTAIAATAEGTATADGKATLDAKPHETLESIILRRALANGLRSPEVFVDSVLDGALKAPSSGYANLDEPMKAALRQLMINVVGLRDHEHVRATVSAATAAATAAATEKSKRPSH